MAKSNKANFWYISITIAALVMVASLVFFLYEPTDGKEMTSSESESDSNVAENVSRFYAQLMSSKSPIQERYGDYVIVLEEEDTTVTERINNITKINYPPVKNWQGEYKQRAFASGSTLRTEASNFVAKAGYTLVWDLNQDFVIRDRFVSDGTIVGMLEEISGAVDSNFDRPIGIYFCFKKRAIVVTESETEYLKKNCEKSTDSTFQDY